MQVFNDEQHWLIVRRGSEAMGKRRKQPLALHHLVKVRRSRGSSRQAEFRKKYAHLARERLDARRDNIGRIASEAIAQEVEQRRVWGSVILGEKIGRAHV